MARLTWLGSVASAWLLSGCGLFGGVRVETARVSAQPPADIRLYVSVEDHGQPVDYLDDGSFQIYENDVLLQSADVGLRLLPRDSISVGHTVLLLDLSGEPDAALLAKLKSGATQFVAKVSVTQDVTVLAFDGAPGVRQVASFSRVATEEVRELPDLSAFVSGDSSRDLRGATLESLASLGRELGKSKKEVRLGTLVVLARGPDLAGRRTDRDLYAALTDSKAEHYLLRPETAEIQEAGALGEDGSFTFQNVDELPMRLQDLGMLVRKAWGRHYLLAYCSPSRAGHREVTIAVRFSDAEGAGRSGSGEAEFVADGFTAGCRPPQATASSRLFEEQAPSAESTEPAARTTSPEPTPAAPKKKPLTGSKPGGSGSTAQKPEAKPAEAKPSEPVRTEEVVAPPSSGKYK